MRAPTRSHGVTCESKAHAHLRRADPAGWPQDLKTPRHERPSATPTYLIRMPTYDARSPNSHANPRHLPTYDARTPKTRAIPQYPRPPAAG